MSDELQAGPGNRAAAYQRISHIYQAGDEHGVNNQRSDQERAAAARGYTIVMSESDNDISALTGKHRPGYERVMAAARRREIDVILVFQTSRFWRNRKERAEGIEILRDAGVSIVATKGPSLDLTTAYGRMMAGLIGEFDTAESEVKAERQQLANSEAAKAGKPRLATTRPFGWGPDYVTAAPAEKAAVEDACRALLAGGTLAGVAREWARRGLRSHKAPFGPLPENPWTVPAVKQILLNPRNAGIVIYRGAEIGRGEWEPLVLEETWRALVQMFADPRRKMAKGVTSMLGGLALCQCGNQATGNRAKSGIPLYVCAHATRGNRPGPHAYLRRACVDQAVGDLVIARMAQDDAAGLLPPQDQGDAGALKDEAQAIGARLAALPKMFMRGDLDEREVAEARAEGRHRLAELEERLAELGRESVLAPFFASASSAAVWAGLADDRRRAVVDVLMTVVLHAPGRGARQFDRGQVLPPDRGIIWKGKPPATGSACPPSSP